MPLLILGVGHVFHIGDAIETVIVREAPEVVALELDRRRYQGLLARQQGQARPPVVGPRVYRMLAKFQEEVAQSYGAEVGGEMTAAIRAAGRVGAKLALVDRPAEEAVRRVWKEMTWREKFRLFWSGISARFSTKMGDQVQEEVRRYQENPERYLDELGSEFPTVKRVLLDERNEWMAKQLREIASQQRVVAIVGDGHVDGLVRLLRDLGPRTVRLAELQKEAPTGPNVRWGGSGRGDQVGFWFDQSSLEGGFRRA